MADRPLLFDSFQSPTRADWLERAAGKNDAGPDRILAVGHGIRADAYPSESRQIELESRPSGWRYAEPLLGGDLQGYLKQAKDAQLGEADVCLTRIGSGALEPEAFQAFLSEIAIPAMAWTQDLALTDLPLLGPDLSGGATFDPVATALRLGASPDFSGLDRAVQGSGEAPVFCVDLTVWDELGAEEIQLAAAAFAGVSEWLYQIGRLDQAPAAIDMTILIPVGTSFFPSIALVRAIRAGIGRVSRQYSTACRAHIHTITSSVALGDTTAPENLLRTTTSSMAAILGGAETVSILAHDTPDGATEKGQHLARGISHLLSQESYLGLVSDPAAGSRYIECLTSLIGEEAWAQFQTWEGQGGLLEALAGGGPQESLQADRARRDADFESGAQVRVGMNRFRSTEEAAS